MGLLCCGWGGFGGWFWGFWFLVCKQKLKRTDAPSTSSAALSRALSTAGAKAETLAAKVGRIREALGLPGSMPVATVLLEAYKELGLPPPEAVLLPAQAAELLQVLGI
jgi:hypothetical protein